MTRREVAQVRPIDLETDVEPVLGSRSYGSEEDELAELEQALAELEDQADDDLNGEDAGDEKEE